MDYWEEEQQLLLQLDLKQHQKTNHPFIPLRQLRWLTEEKEKETRNVSIILRYVITDTSKSII